MIICRIFLTLEPVIVNAAKHGQILFSFLFEKVRFDFRGYKRLLMNDARGVYNWQILTLASLYFNQVLIYLFLQVHIIVICVHPFVQVTLDP